MKKLLSIIISILIVFISVSGTVSAFAVNSATGKCGDNISFSYTKNNNIGVLTLYGTGETYNYDKTKITSPFYKMTDINYLIIDEGITGLGSYLFYQCTGMQNITFPSSLVYVGEHGFDNCISLDKININSIEDWCNIEFFDNYSNPLQYSAALYVNNIKQTDVEIPNTVIKIPDYSFSEYLSLNSISIPHSVKSVGDYAFSGCSNLVSIDFPDSVTSIGSGVFSNCFSLNSVCFPDGLTEISDSLFFNCKSIENVDLPESVLSIGRNAFSGCLKLSALDLPNELRTIKSGAFADCTSLDYVNIDSVEHWCGIDIDYSGSDYFYKSNPIYYSKALYVNNKLLEDLTIPSRIKNIKKYTFAFCKSIKNVSILSNIESIENGAFFECKNIEKVNTNSIMVWCNIEFSDYTSNPVYYSRNLYVDGELLRELIIPNDIIKLGDYSLSGCDSLEKVNIPNGVLDVSNAFSNCINIKEIVIPESVKDIKIDAFSNCASLSKIVFPNSISSVNPATLYGCVNIKEVYVLNPNFSSQGLISGMPQGSTLYAYNSTDASTYCDIYNIQFVALDEIGCGLGFHLYQKHVVESSCINEGHITFICEKCGVSYTVTQPLKDHTIITDDEVAPTCTNTGLTEGSHCSVCGKIFVAQRSIDALGHDYGEWKQTKAPTCTEKGEETRYCSRCDATETREIAAYGHNYITAITKPTCTNQGYTTYTCTKCEDVYTDDYINAISHKWNNGKITATTATTYTITYTCTVCKKATIKKTFNKKANTIVAKGKTATVKFANLKKKNQTVAQKNAFAVSKAQGKVTYVKASGNKKITVAKNGNITVKKGLKKGSYKVKVKVKAAGNATYKAKTVTVTVTIKVN